MAEIPERCDICGCEIVLPDAPAAIAICAHTFLPPRLERAEARIRELEQEREWARVALGAGIVERDKAQAQLQAVTQELQEYRSGKRR